LKARSLLVNVTLSLAVTVAFLALLEGGARLVQRRKPPRAEVARYIWDWDEKMPGGFYVMKSDGVGWPPWEEFNGDGVRDRTRSREKADLVRRVAVLGDSVTLGDGLRPEEAYPQVLEARFAAEGRPVEVMSVALWGWSTRQERIAWGRIARAYAPDAAVLAVCLNDIPELFNNLSRPPRWLAAIHARSALVRLVVDAEGREIDSVERLFAEAGRARVDKAIAAFFEEVRALRGEVEKDGASLALVVFPFRFQVQPGAPRPVVQERIAAFCRAEGLRCLDLLPALAPLGVAAFEDYDHLSPGGARAAAEAIATSGVLQAPRAAGELLPPSVDAATLAPLLTSADAPVRLAAAWAASRLARDAAVRRALLAALRQDRSTAVRAQAARSLASAGAEDALFAALADASEAVRHEVALALSRSARVAGDVPKLVAALGSPDDYVSAFAAWSLGNLGAAAKDSVPALAGALARERTNAVVAAALARIGPAAAGAVPTLAEALRGDDPDRRWRAARTLGRIGPAAAAAVGPLTDALGDAGNSDLRLHAARALGRIGAAARPAAAALQRATGDPDENVRREAKQALERLQ
jgi:HEAT repeat protein/lysophospholipase L1-like esterase